MAKNTFEGNAPSVGQIDEAVVGSNTLGHTFIFTATDLNTGDTDIETYTATGSEGSNAAVADAIILMLERSTKRLFQRLLFDIDEVNPAKIAITAKSPGQPFSIAYTGTGTWTSTATVRNSSGPNDWKCPANWSAGDLPANADDVTIASGSAVLENLNDSAKTYAAVVRADGATAQLGRGPGERLRFACTSFVDRGSGQAWLDFGGSTIAPEIHNKRQFGPFGQGNSGFDVDFIGTAITGVKAFCGRVGIAVNAGDATPCPTAELFGGYVVLGKGVTGHTTFTQQKGGGEIHCAAQDITVWSGTLKHLHTASDALGNIKADGPKALVEIATPGGNVTLSEAYDGGHVIFSHPTATRTVVTMKEGGGGKHTYDPAKVSPTNYVAVGRDRFGSGEID
jgi:hypothetical protein